MASAPNDKLFNIDIVSIGTHTDQPSFPSEGRQYRVHVRDREGATVTFPWQDATIHEDLSAMMSSNPDQEVIKRLGIKLRTFLDDTNWSKIESEVEHRIMAQQPVDIVISSNAPEIYALPWEFLVVKRSNRPLGAHHNCLIHYDWIEEPSYEPRLPRSGLVLLAWSDAGGQVPFQAHEEALTKAFAKAKLPCALKLKVLQRATPKMLKLALNDSENPVTVLHLLCHGAKTGSGAPSLMLNRDGEEDGVARVDAAAFQQYFPPSTPPRLVVLSICQSGDSGAPHILGGFAQNLHRQDIPAVIASRLPLSCDGSKLLTHELYDDLLAGSGDLRQAFLKARSKIALQQRRSDWISLQLYARRNHPEAFDPLCLQPRPRSGSAQSDVVLICHEALSKVPQKPEFPNKRIRKTYYIKQTPLLDQRQWENLGQAIKDMIDPEGDLKQALAEPDAEFAYYGLPYIPLGALAGFLAGRNRHVHVFELERTTKQFTWRQGGDAPALTIDPQPGQATRGALRLRLSISNKVDLADCQRVLPDKKVTLDLHFALPDPKPDLIHSEEQARAYIEILRDKIHTYTQSLNIQSIHIFASIPVSITFLLGQQLSSTWFPTPYVYNFGKDESPRYKWRLNLRAAAQGKPSIRIFRK